MDETTYTFEVEHINKLMNENFTLTNDRFDAWSKDRLASVKLLSQVFNDYIDLAQETMDFTELNELTPDSQIKLKSTLLKNLLFIFKITQDKQLNINDLLQSLQTAPAL